jgi:hypothetical protein
MLFFLLPLILGFTTTDYFSTEKLLVSEYVQSHCCCKDDGNLKSDFPTEYRWMNYFLKTGKIGDFIYKYKNEKHSNK